MWIFRPASLVALAAGFTLAAQSVDFQRDVRPILSDNCFACHGPDKDSRLAGLRLDRREDALAPRAKGAAIVPGDPAGSLLYQRIVAEKPALRMPPVYSHKSLTSAQIDTLKRWIGQGAPWTGHWSFVNPRRPQPPAVHTAAWPRNPIDNFILARLEYANLAPAPEAPSHRLIRRLALDLTGLPPTPGETRDFVTGKITYDQAVDRYLASPRYGEHRARYWLDAARYADTHGIHIDNYREMWPYRDWVINAFNRNLPFDQFTIEQLAGDLLPNPTLDQRTATGFHRSNVTTNEAGIIAEEYEAIYAKDRVDTTGAVWLGLTIGCAACHDHKFDPLTQRDHYSLAAFFRNTTQPVMDGNVSDTPPVIVVPKIEDRERWLALQREQAAAKARQTQLAASPGPYPSQPKAPIEDASQLYARLDETAFTARQTIDLPSQPAFDAAKPFSIAFWLRMPMTEESLVALSQMVPGNDKKKTKSRGWLFEIGARVPNFRVIGDDGNTLDARAGHLDQLLPGTWTHVVVTYDGTAERMGFSMFLNGKPIDLQGAEPLTRLKGNFATKAPLRLGGDGKRFFEGGAIRDLRIFNRALSEDDARLVSLWPKIQDAEPAALRLHYVRHHDSAYKALTARLAALDLERRAIRRRAAVTHVMEERADRAPFAHILYRGMYDQPRDRVEPSVPAALPAMPAAYPRDRLGLARWFVDEENPLTARVTVNRFWQEIFGAGLVKTSEDFGSQGEAPSHPELLDWLAVEFRESGWDVKKLMRLLVTTSTYRQAAIATDEKLKADPDNRLLSRGPRFRMDGEMVRDYALAAGGLLSSAIGGPSVKPYQPDGIWETVAMLGSNTRFYKHDSGEKLYRRSLYTFWKRSAPPASMEIFNAPTREACIVRRERTNTPLQALVTMNDIQFVEAARALAERSFSAGPFDARLDHVAAALLARPLDDRERNIARSEYRDYLAYYDAHPDDAKKLLATGESKPRGKIPRAEFAAMTMLVNQLMNLDEVLNK